MTTTKAATTTQCPPPCPPNAPPWLPTHNRAQHTLQKECSCAVPLLAQSASTPSGGCCRDGLCHQGHTEPHCIHLQHINMIGTASTPALPQNTRKLRHPHEHTTHKGQANVFSLAGSVSLHTIIETVRRPAVTPRPCSTLHPAHETAATSLQQASRGQGRDLL
jgi:hypothetical protein